MEFSADEISQEIDDHVMEADLALIVPMDEIEGVDGLFCSNQQCGAAPHRHLRCWARSVFLFDGPFLLQT